MVCPGSLRAPGAVPLAQEVLVSAQQCRQGCSSLIAGTHKARVVICSPERLCQQMVVQGAAIQPAPHSEPALPALAIRTQNMGKLHPLEPARSTGPPNICVDSVIQEL